MLRRQCEGDEMLIIHFEDSATPSSSNNRDKTPAGRKGRGTMKIKEFCQVQDKEGCWIRYKRKEEIMHVLCNMV